jgi:hypothetical protein
MTHICKSTVEDRFLKIYNKNKQFIAPKTSGFSEMTVTGPDL